MQISSRFTAALHVLACIDAFGKEYKITSEFLSGSTNIHPVIIRNITGQLKKSGIVNVSRGVGGVELSKHPSEVTFLDIYKAVEPTEDGQLFRFHPNPNPDCPIGGHIHEMLDGVLMDFQASMENEMKQYTLEDLHVLVQTYRGDKK